MRPTHAPRRTVQAVLLGLAGLLVLLAAGISPLTGLLALALLLVALSRIRAASRRSNYSASSLTSQAGAKTCAGHVSRSRDRWVLNVLNPVEHCD